MKFRRDESGYVLLLVALCLPIMLGFLGLAIDVGLLFRARRNVQTTADSAAVAAALDYLYNNSVTSAQNAGAAAATANGITAAPGGPSVTVNVPPTSGPNKGVAGFAEVIISEPSPTFFLGMATGGTSAVVSARAVAGSPGPSGDCVFILDPTASAAMNLQGSFDVTANCGVIVDSNSPSALSFTGAGGTLTAASVSVVGGDSGQTGDSTPTPITGSAPVSDPIRITGPTPTNGQCTSTDSTTTTLTGTIAGPGAGYSVCYTKAVTLSNVTLGNGIYAFENGVTTSGNVTTTVTTNGGATIDVEAGAFTVNTGTVLNITAPTMGTTNGIALMEPATNSSTITIQKGDASGSLTGIIYAPSAQLYLQDSGGDKSGGLSITSDLIVDELFDKTATLTIASYSYLYASTPLRAVALVE